jgi:hypothetical protein
MASDDQAVHLNHSSLGNKGLQEGDRDDSARYTHRARKDTGGIQAAVRPYCP